MLGELPLFTPIVSPAIGVRSTSPAGPRITRKSATGKIDRIGKLPLEEFRFPCPEDFSLPAHLAKSFGVFRGDGEVHVQLRFAPRVARYVQESNWHDG